MFGEGVRSLRLRMHGGQNAVALLKAELRERDGTREGWGESPLLFASLEGWVGFWLVGLVASSHLAVFAEQVLEVALLSLGCKAVNEEVVAGVDALVGDVGADDKRMILSWRVSVRLVIEVGISSCDQALSVSLWMSVLFFCIVARDSEARRSEVVRVVSCCVVVIMVRHENKRNGIGKDN